MQCLSDNTGGNYTTLTPQPSDMATCTLILVSPAEFQANKTNWTMEEADSLVGTALMLFGLAWLFKLVRYQLIGK